MVPISRLGLGGLQKVLERMLQADSLRSGETSALPLPGAVTVSLPVVIGRSAWLSCMGRRLDWLVFDGQIRY
jgi:hypothetical protein